MREDPFEEQALRHLYAELEWLRVLLNVHARRVLEAAPAATDAALAEDDGSRYVPVRLPPRPDAFAPPRPLEADELAALEEADMNRRATSASLEGAKLPLPMLVERFALSDEDYLILLLAVANEFAPDFPRIFAVLHQHTEHRHPTLGLAMMALFEPAAWPRVRARLAPDAPLRRYRLILVGTEHDPDAPLTQRRIVLAERIRAFVAGEHGLDPQLDAYVDLRPVSGFSSAMLISDDVGATLARIKRLVDRFRGRFSEMPMIVIRGPAGGGRRRVAHAVAEHLGMGSLAIDLAGLAIDPRGIEVGLQMALCEAKLHDALLCLRGWDEWTGGQLVASTEEDEGFVNAATENLLRRGTLLFEKLLSAHDGPIALLVSDPDVHPPDLRRGIERFELVMPDADTATELWRRSLANGAAASPVLARQLGVTFRMTPNQIEKAATSALLFATIDDAPVDFDMVQRIIKGQLRHRLGNIATLKSSRYTWDDLIVTPAVMVQLREIISRYRFKHTVMEDWRFGARFGTGVGISALFQGPPGTGKTMAASIISQELGLDLFQVDLSAIVSKYIGETEKQLSTLFTEAENAGAIILFDEADSLFSKRTEVKSSNDRYSNLKTNYLLQRIEQFSGIAILTTNFAESIDEAFTRRVTMKVRFIEPDKAARLRIWENMLGSEPILAEDIYLEEIAHTFEMSGGHIKNAVLRAAYIAAARDALIDHDTLILAARIEQMQQGKVLLGDPLRDLANSYDAQDD